MDGEGEERIVEVDSGGGKLAIVSIDDGARTDEYVEPETAGARIDPVEWAMGFGKVSDRVTREAVPFVPSELQRRMFQRYVFCEERQIPCRMVVTKTRRGGGSTGAAALMYLHANRYQARLGAVGTDEAVGMNMFSMVRFFEKHDEYPERVAISKTMARGLIEWANGSSWEKYTAENPEAARSAGLQGYHATEVGRWYDGGVKDAKETLRSMLGAVPRRGFTVVIEESTARGAKGAFYERFLGARWPTAEELGVAQGGEYWRTWVEETPQNIAATASERALQFVRVFAAWFEDEENRTHGGVTPEERERIEVTLDEKERELIRRYGNEGPQGWRLGTVAVEATLWDQLAWRRAVIATEFDGDVEGFQQENPASPHEAFASSGRHTFNRSGCAYMVEQSRSRVPEVGVLEAQHDGVVFRRESGEGAWFQMWQEPRECQSYLVSVDTCGGRSNVRNPEETDYHAVLVLRSGFVDASGRREPHAVVATMSPKCQLDPDVLAEKVKLVSLFYGDCLVVFEVNNTGAAFRQDAQRLGLKVYKRTTTNPKTSVSDESDGWLTTKETRHQLIGTLKRHIRNNARAETRGEGVACWSAVVAHECTDMMPGHDGVDRAPGNKHDDHVLALGMALQCVSAATFYPPRKRKRREPADRYRWTRG